jgi:hypothetical protein
MLSRKWWSLRSLEGFLSVATGNPSSISLQDCSVPLPRTLPGNIHGVQSTALLQLFSKITVISQWAVSLLYTGRTATLSQASLQERVSMTKTELETMLPQILEREHLVLQLAWFDAMMLVTRPCLCIQIKSSRLSGPALQILQNMGKTVHTGRSWYHKPTTCPARREHISHWPMVVPLALHCESIEVSALHTLLPEP